MSENEKAHRMPRNTRFVDSDDARAPSRPVHLQKHGSATSGSGAVAHEFVVAEPWYSRCIFVSRQEDMFFGTQSEVRCSEQIPQRGSSYLRENIETWRTQVSVVAVFGGK